MKAIQTPSARISLGLVTVFAVAGLVWTFSTDEQTRPADLAATVETDRSPRVGPDAQLRPESVNRQTDKGSLPAETPLSAYPGVTPRKLEHVFSPNLEGTDIDGQLKVDANGQLELALDVRDFFDYFLSTADIVTPEVSIQEMLLVAEQSIPPEAVEEVKQLLADYLSYKEQAVALMQQPLLPTEQQTQAYQLQVLEDGLKQLRAIRRDTMSPEAVDAFFGLEEAYEDYTLASVRVQMDDRLSEGEKARMIEYHRSQLPEVIRRTEEQLIADAERVAPVYEALNSGDPQNLQAELSARGYSEEQQQEIIKYQKDQADFDRRYDEYAALKRQLPQTFLSEEERDRAVEALRQRYFFSEQELTLARVRDIQS